MLAMTRSRYRVYESQFPYFLTCTIVGWLPIFTRPDTAQIIFDSWQFLHDHGRMQIYGYVILENHLHLIASADDLSKEIGDFKSFTARRLIDFLEQRNLETLLNQLRFHKEKHKTDRDYQIWQEGSHFQQIQCDEILLQKLEYMHRNPVARGYVDEPIHWRWSSARNYARVKPIYAPVRTDWR